MSLEGGVSRPKGDVVIRLSRTEYVTLRSTLRLASLYAAPAVGDLVRNIEKQADLQDRTTGEK